MTGTKDEALAIADREMDLDTGKAAEVLQNRASDLERYNARILELARPIIRDLVVLYGALLSVESDAGCNSDDVLAAISMALDDPRLSATFKRRVAKVRATLATEAARQKRVDVDDARDVPPLEGRG